MERVIKFFMTKFNIFWILQKILDKFIGCSFSISVRSVRILTIVRIVRIARIVRIVRILKDFRNLVLTSSISRRKKTKQTSVLNWQTSLFIKQKSTI